MTLALIHQNVGKPVKVAAAATCLLGVFTGGFAVGQQQPPSENKGVSAKSVGEVKLAAEIEGMGWRLLRLRVVTLEPAGVFALHNHKDRPAVEFILTGNPTEFRGSETTKKGRRYGSVRQRDYALVA